MEDRVLCDAAPQVTLQAPAKAKIGESVQVTASFDNTSTTQTGYGPYIDLLIDKTGADGAGAAIDDGLTFNGATYLGQNLTTTILTFNAAGKATHPYAKDNTGAALIIDAATLGYEPGDQLIVIQLPYGSFAPAQPAADVTISLAMSNLADADAPLKISARGGFQYGNDALDNSASDPSVVGGLNNASVTPSVVTVTKNYLGPENETATGPNFVRQYEIVLDVAPGQTLTNVHLVDVLAAAGIDAHQFTGISSVTANGSTLTPGSGYSVISAPSTTTPGGMLDVLIPTVNGTASTRDAVLTFSFYIPRIDTASGNAVVINASTGDDNIISSQAYGYGSWTPIDTPRDPATTVSDQTAAPNGTTPDADSEHDLEAQSIAIQKTITNVIRNGSSLGVLANDQILPGDVVEFTLSFQISDYFAFQNISITDIMSDGWHLDLSAVTPTLSINGNTYVLPAAAIGSTRYTSTIDTDNIYGNATGTGNTTMVFDVSAELAARASSISTSTNAEIADKAYALLGQLLGGGVNPMTPNGGINNDLSGYNAGATTGQIVYRAVVLDKFTDAAPGATPNTSTEASLNPRDQLFNSAVINGSVIDLAAAGSNSANTDANPNNNVLVTTGSTEADDTGLTVSIRQDSVQKQIYAVNGVLNGTPAFNAQFRTGGLATGTINLKPGDAVTYRITYTIPTGDVEHLRFTDYLPLPIYSVTDANADGTPSGFTFFNNIVAGNPTAVIPAAGVVTYGPTHTLNDVANITYDSGVQDVLTISTDATSNSLTIGVGTTIDTTNTSRTIDLLLTITVNNEAFADGLFLTNQVQSGERNTQLPNVANEANSNAIIQIQLNEPTIANIYKGVVASTQGGAAPATGGLTFNGVGGNGFSGTLVGGANAAAIGALNLTSGTLPDAGDIVRFALIAQNTGRSDAFDVTLQDTIRGSYVNNYADAVTFAAATNFKVYNGAGALLALGTDYTLTWDNTSKAFTVTLVDSPTQGKLNQGQNPTVAGSPQTSDGSNAVVVLYDLTVDSDAQVGSTIRNTATLTKYTGTDGATGTGTNFATQPLTDTADVTIRQPTFSKTLIGTGINTTGNDNLTQAVIGELVTYRVTVTVPEGTTNLASIVDTLDAGLAFVAITNVTSSPGVSASVPTLGTTPAFTAVTNAGRTVTFSLGAITNTNTNNGVAETIVIEYTAVVLDTAGNQAGTLLNNSATLTASWNNDGVTSPATGSVNLSASANNVTVVEPTATVSNSLSLDNVTYVDNGTTTVIAGQTIYYKVVITNTSSVWAHDISLYDRLPTVFSQADTSVFSVTSTSGTTQFDTNSAGGYANFAIGLDTAFGNNKPVLYSTSTLAGLAPGESVTVVVKSRVIDNAVSASTHPNGVQIRWTSIDDDVRSTDAVDTTPTGVTFPGANTPIQRSTYNAASVERTGSDGPPTDSPANTLPLNNYAATDDLTATILQVLPIGLQKEFLSTEINNSTNSNTQAVIGEYATYRVTFAIPRGVTQNFILTDTLNTGLAFVDITSVTSGPNVTTNVDGSGNATANSLAPGNSAAVNLAHLQGDTVVTANGTQIVINLGNVINNEPQPTPGQFVPPQEIVVTYRVLVTNTAANQSGVIRNNTAVLDYDSVVDTTPIHIQISDTPPTPITIIEPTLTVTKTATTSGPYDAGDTVQYSIVIQHPGGSETDAFDLIFSDTLSSQLLAFTSGLAFSNAALGTDITITHSSAGDVSSQFEIVGGVLQTKPTADIDLLKTQTLTITVKAKIAGTAQAGLQIGNTANLKWTSINGAPTLNSPYTTTDTERDGSGGVNDYTGSSTANIVMSAPSIDKTFKDGSITNDDTNVASSTGSNVVIGEQVTYDLLVTLPEGVNRDIRVQDIIPAGLRVDSISILTASGSSGLLTNNFNGSFGTTPTLGAPVTGSTTLVLDFDDITVAPDNDATNNKFVVRVTATVLNINNNQAGTTRTNTARIVFNDPDGATNTGPAADQTLNDSNAGNDPVVTIREATLTVVKSKVESTPLDAGATIDYTITISNTSGQTGYDVTLSDAINQYLIVTQGFLGTIPNSSVTASAGATVSANAFEIVDTGGGVFVLRTAAGANVDIPNGESVTIKYRGTVSGSVPAAATITNVANVRWSSLDGGLNGSQAGTVNERTGSDVADPAPTSLTQTSTTTLNDYALSSGVISTPINNVTVAKTLLTTSLGGADGVATPGELVTYQITVTLPEGVTPDLQIRDAIPTGMAYVPGSLTLVTGTYAGSVGAPAVSPQSGTTYGDGTDILFDFASISTTGDNDTTNNTFTFTYQTVVLDIAANVGVAPLANQKVLTNTATHNNGGADPGFATSAGSASVTVVEPQYTVTNNLSITGTKDAGAPFTYTITVQPTANATSNAYEVSIADLLPGEFGSLAISSAIVSDGATNTNVAGNFTLTGNSLSTSAPLTLLLNTNGTNDQVLTITLTGMLTSQVNPGEVVNTSTSLLYTNYPGDRTVAGSFNPNPDVTTDHERTYSGSDTESFTAPIASLTKSLFSTDQTFTSGGNVAIGEQVTYALLVTLPEGTTPDLSVIDRLPNGLQYTGVSSIVTTAAASGGLLVADFNGTVPAPSITGGATNGAAVNYTFGSISVTGDNVANNNSFLILVTARVTNTNTSSTVNQAGGVLANDATFDISGDGQGVFTTPVVNVTVVEPRVVVAKSVLSATTGVDAGDTITYQIVINNTAGNGATTDAFDVSLADVLPAGLLITGIGSPSLTGGATQDIALSGTGTSTLNGIFDIPLGGSVTFTYTAQVPNTVTPGQVLTSDLNVTFTSLDGTNANERTGADVADPENNTPPTNNAILNNYAVGVDTSVTAANPFSVTKSLIDTSLGNDTSLNVVVGETLTYQLTVGVMEGTTSSLSLIDTLPRLAGVNQLTYVPGSAVVTNSNGMTISGFTVAYNPTTNQLTITSTSVVNPGNVDNAGAADTDNFTISYQVQVADVAQNQSGTNLTNDVDATAIGVPPDNNNQITVNVREPVLSLTKTTTTPGTDGGDAVLYTLVISNTGNATAYEVRIQDLLDSALQFVTPGSALTITSGTTAYATLTQTGNTASAVDTILNRLDAGDSITITISAQVKAGATAGDTISNTASITYTSLPGTQAGERTGGGGVDDYNATASSADFTLARPTIDKLTPSDTTYSIGETVTYDIIVTLPEGTTNGLVITDNLPAGLTYISVQIITSAAASGGLLSGDFAGAVGAPTVANPSGNTRTFTFGDTTATANNTAGDNKFIVRVTAQVADIAGNQGAGSPGAATTFSNTATLQYTDGTTPGTTTVTDPTAPGPITVVEPVLAINKTITTPTAGVDAGDTVTYQIVVNHTGASTADAFDLNLSDDMPAALGTSITIASAFIGSTDVSSAFAINGSGDLVTIGDIDLPVGQTLTIVLSGTVRNQVTPTSTIANAATVTWTSVNGVVAGERTGAGGVDDYTATSLAPTITIGGVFTVDKTLVNTTLGNDTNPNVVVGEVLTYQIAVTVGEGTLNNLSLIDALPIISGSNGLTYVPSSASVSNANGITVNGFTANYNSGTNQLTITATSVVNPGGSNGTVNNGATLESDTFYITYQVQVANIIGNQNTVTLVNNVSGTATNVPPDNNNQVTVTVREPVLLLTKTTTTPGLDGGDNVVYTLVISNSGTASAYDVNILDTIDAALQLTTPGAALTITNGPGYATLTQAGNTASAVNTILNRLDVGDSVTITISAQVRPGANAGDTISNSASITYTSLPGTQTGERTGTGGVNDYTTSASSADFVLAKPTIDKLTPSDTTYSIGETVTYDILVTLPEGTTQGLVITDNLPAGLIYTGVQVITSAAASGGLLSASYNGTVGAPTVANPSGNVRTFTFGDVTTTADNVGGNNTFLVRVTAQVADISGNQGAGSPGVATTFSNTATLQYTDGTTPGTTTVTDPTTPGPITVVEPVLAIDKTITTPTTNIDAGDTVTYQIVINHTGASTADAFDLNLSDDLPAGLNGVTIVSALIGSTNVSSLFAINGSGDLVTTGDVDLLMGQTLTIVLSGTVRDQATPGSTIANAATVTWTSVNGVLAGERTGAGGGDDYTATDLAPTITVGGAFNVDKTLVNTTLGNDTSTNVVVGEVLTYQIAVTVGEGTLSNLSLIDALPIIGGANGLTYLPGSAAISNANGITINGFAANYNAGTNQLSLSATSIVNPGGSNGTTNSGATLETDTFYITYQVRVSNIIGNQSTVTLVNNVSGSVTELPPDNNNQVTVTVREPVLTLTKTTTTPGIDGGDGVIYTLVITNTGSAAAYDVSILDTLDTALQLAAPGTALSITAGPAYAGLNQAGNTAAAVSTILNQLNAGDSVTITISAQVKAGATPGDTISNTATITYTSLPGTQTGERDGSGGVNDYTTSSTSADFVLAKPTIDKLTPSDTTYSIGETVTYDILITLPEGVTDGLIVTDNLPAGLVYTGAQVIASSFNGTVGAPTVGNPAGNTRTFNFGTVTTTADNNAGNNTFILRVTARVDNILANQGVNSPGTATTFSNTATLVYTDGTTGTTTITDPTAPGPITVVEPVLTFDKTIASTSTGSTTDLDAGDTVTYQVTFTNNGTATAHDVALSDLLPAGLLITSINAPTLGGGATMDTALAGLGTTSLTGEFTVPIGGSVTFTYVATIQNSITPGTSFANSAKITWTSIDGTDANERTGATGTQHDGSLNDYSLTDTVTIGTSSVSTFSKSLFTTDQTFTTGSNVAIGENVVFALKITLPEGTTPDLSVIDRLPAGLQYISSSIVTSAAASNGLLLADFSGTIPNPAVGGGSSDGADVSYTFGAITTNGDNNANSNSFLILITARVTNTLGNQSGTTLSNDATFDISSDAQAIFTTPVVNTTVVEPRVTVNKVITTATSGIDAGDSITYQITLNNLGANGAATDAFDVNLSDMLPPGLLITSIGVPSLSGGASIETALGGVGSSNLTGVFDLPLGGSITFTYTAQVQNTVAPGQVLTGDLNVFFSSLNDANANERTGADVADPEDNTPPADGATLNNYAVGADATVTAVNPFSVTKTLLNTTLGNDTSTDVVIGETLTYQLAVSVMEGTTSSLSLVDTLAAGLSYIPGSVTITDANGVTINNFAVSLAGNQLTLTATSVVNPGGSNGTTDDPATADTDTFIITYQVQVANVVGNQNGTTLANGVVGTATGVPPDNDNQVTVTVREPVLTLDKTTTVSGLDGGDSVIYTLVIQNTGNATAYDVNILDTLDAALQLATPGTALSITAGPAYASLNQTGNTAALVNSILNQLNAGDSITITISALVKADASAGDTISNTASITYTSLPGTQTGERDGTDGPGGSLNDYTATDSSTDFTLATPTIDKLTPSDTTYSIGELVTYDILITLPEGSTNGLVITDNLPAGLIYTSFQVVTSATASNGLLGADYNGVPGVPTVGNPSGNTRTFNFGTVVTTADNVTGNNTFILRVTARVDNILANQGAGSPNAATLFSNTATLQYTDGTIGTSTVTDPTTPGDITVVEPVLSFDKSTSSDTTDLDAGNTIQFTITFSNTGTATAHDVKLVDLLPQGMLITSIDNVSTSGGVTTETAVAGLGTRNLAGEFTVPVGGQVTVVYTVTLQSNVAPGATLTNAAGITWTSIDGVDANERTGTDGTQDGGSVNDYQLNDSVTITTNATVTLEKTLVGTSDPTTTGSNVTIGETATFNLAVTLHQGVTDVAKLTDTLPTGVAYVDGSAVFRATTPGSTAVGAFSGFTYTDGAPIQAADLTYSGNTIVILLKDITIPSTGASGVGTFSIEYTSLVQDAGTNIAGTTLTNGAVAQADLNNDGDADDPSETTTPSTQTLTVVEPLLQVTKTNNDLDSIVTAGETVTYTLTVTNTGTATAYDVLLRDVIPAGLLYVPGSVTFVSGIAPDASSLMVSVATLTARFSALGVGESATITFQAVVQSTGSLQNNVRVFYDSLAGDEPTHSIIDQTPDGTPDRDYGADGGFDGSIEDPGADTDPAQATNLVTLGTGTIGDRLWFDRNADGVQDANEPGLIGVTVKLTGFNPDGSTYTLTATTGANGAYLFTDLAPTTGTDTYTVTVVNTTLPGGATPTFDFDGIATPNAAVTPLGNGENQTALDFGYNGPGSLGDTIWLDRDGNGVKNGQEPGIANVTLNLVWDENGNGTIDSGELVLGTVTTDLNGVYNFGNLIAGKYLVQVTDTNSILTDAVQTYDLDGIATANIASATLTSATLNRADVDFGYRGTAIISGRSYNDQLKNGNLDGTDTGIGGVKIELIWDQNHNGIDPSDAIVTVTTAANGTYSFDQLLAGTYYVRETQPTGFGQGTENGTDLASVTLPTATTTATDVDFGNTTGSIAGRVFVDANNNGVDDGETGIAGAGVTLLWSGPDGVFGNADDRSVLVTTDANGSYVFDSSNTANLLSGFGDTHSGLLSTGSYRIAESQPPAYLDGADIVGNASVSTGAVDEGTHPGLGGRGADQIGTGNNNIRIAAGESATGYKFGEINPASISGHVFVDKNDDGVKQKSEQGISGVQLHLTGIDDLGNAVDATVQTDRKGEFNFEFLRPGTYEIRETQPQSYLDGKETVGTASGTRSKNDTLSGITLSAGQQAAEYAFGEKLRPVVTVPLIEEPEPEPQIPFAFDGFQNFNPFGFFQTRPYLDINPFHSPSEEQRYVGVGPIDVYRPAVLPLMPVYSGTSNPGATMVIDLYNANGEKVGSQTVTADAGGNWLAAFPTTVLRDYPATLMISQSPIGAFGDINGNNLRAYFSPTINAGEFSYSTEGSLSIGGNDSAPLLGGLVVKNPLSLGSVKYGGEFLSGPGAPSGR